MSFGMCLVKALGELRRCQDELLHRRWLAVVLADPPMGMMPTERRRHTADLCRYVRTSGTDEYDPTVPDVDPATW